jgi:putative transposase
MALTEVKPIERIGLIHHSDRGAQYCSQNYVHLLQDEKVLISMTQKGDPYENALAERVNGILKTEWIHSEVYNSFDHASIRVPEIIGIYNSARPHLSCVMLTPTVAHLITGKLKKRWKNYTRKPSEPIMVV